MQHAKEQELIAFYDGKLDYYSPASQAELQRIATLVGAPTTGKMLDVGCGDGRACFYAITHGMRYTGVDYSAERIKKARKEFGWDPELIVGDVYEVLEGSLPHYDFIWCCELLEHLEEPARIWLAMQELCNGMVVCTVPVDMPYHAHLQVFEDDAAIRATFSDITSLQHVACRTPGGNMRDHFVFTWQPHD